MNENELFLISIGGSGTRVIESLIHMLAIGGKSQGWPEKIHILIMEMDDANGNLDRLKNLHSRYEKLHSVFNNFSQPIGCFWPDVRLYCWTPSGNDPIQQMDMRTMVNADANATIFSKLLYTENEMNMTIDVGFKGRPAVGVAYFKKLTDAQGSTRQALVEFARSAATAQTDRILVISSCHGGTGATGIPKIESILRDPNLDEALGKDLSLNPSLSLGLLLMLPTFSVPKDMMAVKSNNGIDSNNFNDKVKTVLSYYASENLLSEQETGDKKHGYKWTFLLGYPDPIPFDVYSEGRRNQCNPTTFLDWYACVAIKRFYDGDIRQEDGTIDTLRPGLYMSQLNDHPWDFRRFQESFHSLSDDVTAMLQIANLYHESIRPALRSLCQLDPSDRKSIWQIRTQYPFLADFLPRQEDALDRQSIAQEFQVFGEYLSSYVVWLYQIMTHIPTGFPETSYDNTCSSFHGIRSKSKMKQLQEAFPKERPECVRSLMFQTFVNAPFLYHLNLNMAHGEKIERPSEPEESFTYLLLQSLDELTSRTSWEKRLNSITSAQSHPTLKSNRVLGMVWPTYCHDKLVPMEGSPLANDLSSKQAVWKLIVSFVQTIRHHYAFGKH